MYRKFFILFKVIFIRFSRPFHFICFAQLYKRYNLKFNILKMTNNAQYKLKIWTVANFLAPIACHHSLLRIKTGRTTALCQCSQPRYSVNLNGGFGHVSSLKLWYFPSGGKSCTRQLFSTRWNVAERNLNMHG